MADFATPLLGISHRQLFGATAGGVSYRLNRKIPTTPGGGGGGKGGGLTKKKGKEGRMDRTEEWNGNEMDKESRMDRIPNGMEWIAPEDQQWFLINGQWKKEEWTNGWI